MPWPISNLDVYISYEKSTGAFHSRNSSDVFCRLLRLSILLCASVDVECGSPQSSSVDCGGGVTLKRRGPDFESGIEIERGVAADELMLGHPRRLPFAQRLTCTIAEACEVTGLGRTKFYELIGDGRVTTMTIGRRRLVIVQSLFSLVGVNATSADRG